MFSGKSFLFSVLLLFFINNRLKAENEIVILKVSEISESLLNDLQFNQDRPHPILEILKARRKTGRKLTAAVLAFPFPFGIVGLHRIYLGCAPYVPVVYIGTLGGVFGLLPLIDCAVILLDKNIDHYANSTKVFMWVD